ncbi:hypothetical protein INS49_004907 [Diaporthe citri]|uniref:uncharacterized protein n=1 Tax=Diaporthe citri TaxID=83186 RepID=UPI001C7E5E4B|nr:uncharacterized protein INS49_004907 [Diaporthe citri]KAG6354302.1 hypothetical protein INS49_004907 [Diaporthe citri]
MASNNVARMATALLTVLCFLNFCEVHEVLITLGMGRVSMANFPATVSSYFDALNHLLASGKVTLERRPEKILKVTDAVMVTVIGALNMDEFTAAFDAACSLISASWPWLTTYNATDVERLHVVHRYRSHIVALRNVFFDFKIPGFVPSLGFCALLHEEAWLDSMQTTIADMHLDCVRCDLRLAKFILRKRRQDDDTDPTCKDQYDKLRMNQARFEGITASMIGKEGKAKEKLQLWLSLLTFRTLAPNSLPDDSRTLPFAYVEVGMSKLRCGTTDESGAFADFQLAINEVDKQRGVGADALKYMLPHVISALFITHYHHPVAQATSILDKLLSERGQLPDLIFDDMTSLETGIVLFAKGAVTYFRPPNTIPSAEVIKEALKFFRRAVTVLEQTHGHEAIWTLAATYRMAVCLFDLGRYEESIVHFDTLNHVYRAYTKEFREHDGSDILWQKARVLWKSGRALLALGDEAQELEAQQMLDEAVQMHWDISGTVADHESMTDASWDSKVFFLYR